MSNGSWQNRLERLLKANERVAVLGIGSTLYGDDAAGLALVRWLRGWHSLPNHWLPLEAGTAPENVLGALRPFEPDVVLVVDSAQMDAPAGTIRWLYWDALEGVSASSHTLPLAALAAYVRATYHCPVALIGIQPATTALGQHLSPPVKGALRELLRVMLGRITPNQTDTTAAG